LFQLELAISEAGDDTNKKAQIVNRIAESISKINKAEDFTKQQDYIRKTSEILKIDEAGLHNLVNKFIRENLSKEEKKLFQPEKSFQRPPGEIDELAQADVPSLELLNDEIYHERSLIRCLLEYGLLDWESEKRVADYLLYEIIEEDTLEDPMLKKILHTYKTWYEEKLEPSPKSFLYTDDLAMSNAVVQLIEFPYEVSEGWESKYEMAVPKREENYRTDIMSTLRYLELKKIKKLILINASELERESNPERQMLLIQTHSQLKNMEMQLTAEIGLVIMK
jgi:DNA primase